MNAKYWKAFRDADGWYLATVRGKPSCRMADKAAAEAEAARRNVLIAQYEKAVLEGTAGRLPAPRGRGWVGAVLLACLVAGTSTAAAADAVVILVQPQPLAHDQATPAGYAEFLRLSGRLDGTRAPDAPGVEAGRLAGQAAVKAAGIHATRLSDAEVTRRAKAAAKAAKVTGAATEAFVSAFGCVFTDARMNAR